jgi:ribonuclease BN (tRNA processing enzyme)
MRMILLGHRGPSTLVSVGGSAHFLVDAGSGVGGQLVQAGVRRHYRGPVTVGEDLLEA